MDGAMRAVTGLMDLLGTIREIYRTHSMAGEAQHSGTRIQPRSAAFNARTASGMSRGRVEPNPSTNPDRRLRPS
jgi:hypothetical protein